MQANSEQYSRVLSVSNSDRSVQDKNRATIAAALEQVAQGIMTQTQQERNSDQYEQEIFELEMKIANPDTEQWSLTLLTKRKKELEGKIKTTTRKSNNN